MLKKMWQMDNYDLMKTCIFLQCAEIEVSEVYVSSVLESTKKIFVLTPAIEVSLMIFV